MNYALFSTSTTSNTPGSGLGTGDTINKIILVWILQGTDDAGASDLTVQANLAAAAANAIAAGRSTTLTAGVNDAAIAAFQTTAGTQIAVGSPTNGQVFIPACQWTENKNGGGTQAGNWTKGSSITFNTATTTTTTTTAAPTTTTAAPTTTTTTTPAPGTLTTSQWSSSVAGTGTATAGTNQYTLNVPGTSSAAAIYYTTGISRSAAKTVTVRINLPAASTAQDIGVHLAQVVPSAGALASVMGVQYNYCGFRVFYDTTDGSWNIGPLWTPTAGQHQVWTTIGAWSTGNTNWLDGHFHVAAGEYDLIFTITTTNISFKVIKVSDGTTVLNTASAPMNWSNLLPASAAGGSVPMTLYPFIGDLYTDANSFMNVVVQGFSIV